MDRVEHVVAGQRLDGERGAGFQRYGVGKRHEDIGRGHRLLRICPPLFNKGRDTVPDLHAADIRPELGHRARDLKARHQRIGEWVRINPGADLRVGPVAAGIGNVDQHFSRAGIWFRHVRHHELIGRAGRVDDDGFHGDLLFVCCDEVRAPWRASGYQANKMIGKTRRSRRSATPLRLARSFSISGRN